MNNHTKRRIVDRARQLAKDSFPEISDFSSHCLVLNGALIPAAKQIANERIILQAGTAYWPRVTRETDDGVEPNRFGYEWSPHDPASATRLAMGLMPEIHVWAACPRTNEVIDLASGAFPTQCERLTGMTWKAPKPPEWFWGSGDKLPELASYVADMEATFFAYRMLNKALTTG